MLPSRYDQGPFGLAESDQSVFRSYALTGVAAAATIKMAITPISCFMKATSRFSQLTEARLSVEIRQFPAAFRVGSPLWPIPLWRGVGANIPLNRRDMQ